MKCSQRNGLILGYLLNIQLVTTTETTRYNSTVYLPGEENTTYAYSDLPLSGTYALRVAVVNDAGTGIFSNTVQAEVEEITSHSSGAMGEHVLFSHSKKKIDVQTCT